MQTNGVDSYFRTKEYYKENQKFKSRFEQAEQSAKMNIGTKKLSSLSSKKKKEWRKTNRPQETSGTLSGIPTYT